MKNTEAKILLLDIETAPLKALAFGLWEVNIGIDHIIEDKYVLMWAAKWLGKKEIFHDTVALHAQPKDYSTIGEKKIAQSIWKLLDEADIVITQNGDSFDLKELNNAFLKHHLPPVSSFKSVDTKKVMKSSFRFLSMKLQFIVRKLGFGHKLSHEGIGLWKGCMAGNETSWKKMVLYCRQDVRLLERLYKALRPFIKNHPNMALYNKDTTQLICSCGSKDFIQKGKAYNATGVYQRYICTKCGTGKTGTKRLNGKGSVNAK